MLAKPPTPAIIASGTARNIGYARVPNSAPSGFVFISYSHTDRDYAADLASYLASHGVESWMDHRLDYGARWPDVIKQQIDGCSAFVVIMTDEAEKSSWVRNEIEHARRRDKPILPLWLSGEVFFGLYDTHYADVRGGRKPDRRYADRLLALIQT
ncbi:toll/interleukin-1 receptor domain-containing protein [Actinoplanes sp. Pm04-4]|uniref:Toll/interleukin-1 receptor domain-containing protein n=1 Tax=Paractinoplanes pyxinae TaxID=2997416 RepID=A0ABT4BE95_9ACTN|nr:toll/interleukin-1 receptor domain-containing protein [Actinoplanes pyxinae]MCY1144145.1 toll/interleukin-1 receptor domain-containing protein [Actinoplanes pyxinae]